MKWLLLLVLLVRKSVEVKCVLAPGQLDQLLEVPLDHVPHLHLLLRHNNRYEDANNVYVEWLLRRSIVQVLVHTYNGSTLPFIPMEERIDAAIVTTTASLIANIEQFILHSSRSSVTFFVLSESESEQYGEINELEESCKLIWQRYKIYNNYILANDGVWYYDPFEPHNGNGNDGRRTYGRLMRYNGKQPLQRQLFRNMRGYPLRIQIFKSVFSRPKLDKITGKITHVEGADALVAKHLSERMNFTMQLQEPEKDYFGERSSNGSYNGAIGSIIADGLDICLTGFFVKDYLVADYMDFSVAVYDDKLCIYVPKAHRIPQSILPIFAVNSDIWLSFIVTAFVCAIIWLIFRIINIRLRLYRHGNGNGNGNGNRHGKINSKLWQQTLRIISDTWVIWVRVNINRFPINYTERIFIASLCLVSVIFGAIFESSLATVYIHPMYYRDIITLNDLDNSGLKVVYKYTSMADDLFFSETSKLFASLSKKLQWNRDLNADVIHEVATIGGKASVSRLSSLQFESYNYLTSKRIWIVPECPKYYTMSYVMPKDAPWGDAVNALLLRLLNAGLIIKWIDDMQTMVHIRSDGEIIETDEEGFRVLTISNLQLAFYVVLGGNLLSALALCVEYFWARFSSHIH